MCIGLREHKDGTVTVLFHTGVKWVKIHGPMPKDEAKYIANVLSRFEKVVRSKLDPAYKATHGPRGGRLPLPQRGRLRIRP